MAELFGNTNRKELYFYPVTDFIHAVSRSSFSLIFLQPPRRFCNFLVTFSYKNFVILLNKTLLYEKKRLLQFKTSVLHPVHYFSLLYSSFLTLGLGPPLWSEGYSLFYFSPFISCSAASGFQGQGRRTGDKRLSCKILSFADWSSLCHKCPNTVSFLRPICR